MTQGFSPKINLFERIEPSKLHSESIAPMRMQNIEQPEGPNFKGVISGLVEKLNTEVSAPDTILNQALVGNADVHDVMAAISKAEIQMNIATTVTTKVLQTYEKVMQIQI